ALPIAGPWTDRYGARARAGPRADGRAPVPHRRSVRSRCGGDEVERESLADTGGIRYDNGAPSGCLSVEGYFCQEVPYNVRHSAVLFYWCITTGLQDPGLHRRDVLLYRCQAV